MRLQLLLAFGLALLVSGVLTFPVRALTRRLGIVDRPNARSSHQIVTPRAGGVAIVLTFFLLVPCFVFPDARLIASGLVVVTVALVSFRDDISSISFKIRLATQTVSAGLLVLMLNLPVKALDLPGVTWELPRILGLALAILLIVAYCNFYNFMDGINGLAAGQAVLTGAALALLLWKAGAGSTAIIAATLSGAAAGFLPHNFPRGRIFMGDVGSVTLGFTLALLSQVAHAAGVSWMTLLLVHAVFLFDATFTLLKRAWRGDCIWEPHREHNYQLLVRNSWSHSATTLILWLLTAESCAAGLIYEWSGETAQWLALLVTTVMLALFAILASRSSMASPLAASPAGVGVAESSADS